MNAWIPEAIAAVEADRATLVARLAKLDSALDVLRTLAADVGEVPAGAPTKAPVAQRAGCGRGRRPAETPAPPAAAAGADSAKVLEVIQQRGPQSGVDMAMHLHVTVTDARRLLEQMGSKGLIHQEGLGRWVKWHLGAKGASRPAPAKEAPSRAR